jgi:hypothetical protein
MAAQLARGRAESNLKVCCIPRQRQENAPALLRRGVAGLFREGQRRTVAFENIDPTEPAAVDKILGFYVILVIYMRSFLGPQPDIDKPADGLWAAG